MLYRATVAVDSEMYTKYINAPGGQNVEFIFNPLPVEFKTLLHGQKGCIFSAGI
jgi:hypothetical protein